MISTQTVLIVAIVDGNFDGDGGVNQTNDCGGDSDKVGVPAVSCACKTALTISQHVTWTSDELLGD